jgi:putative polyhydroxyalkanoate system protein
MPKFSVNASHQLGEEQAVERLKGFLEKVKDRYQSQVSNIQETWNGNQLDFQFTSYGFNIKGLLTAADDDVKIDGDLPFAAMMFKGRIEQTIRDELNRLLA